MSQIRFSLESILRAVVRIVSGTRVAGCVVNVNWNSDNRKWNVNTWKLDDDNWNAGNRAFGRNSRISPALSVREFSFQDHASNRQASFRSQRVVQKELHISGYPKP